MRTVERAAVLFSVILVLTGVACAGNGDREAIEEPTETPSETPASEPSESPSPPDAQDVPVDKANCTKIKTFSVLGRRHVAQGVTPHYNSRPPTSGPHYSEVAQAGVYEQEVPEQALVHNLEHGQIVVWYRPTAPRKVIDALQTEMESQDPVATVVAPYAKIKSPYNFAITAWGAAQFCERVSTEVFDEFRGRYQGKGPEIVGVPPFSDQ